MIPAGLLQAASKDILRCQITQQAAYPESMAVRRVQGETPLDMIPQKRRPAKACKDGQESGGSLSVLLAPVLSDRFLSRQFSAVILCPCIVIRVTTCVRLGEGWRPL